MRYAVLSDIHANAEALEAVMASVETQGVESAVCLGDIVGYGADPREAIRSVREWSDLTVLGNHDNAAVREGGADFFNEWAREAVLWTMEQLDDDEKAFLLELPLIARYEKALLVHASPLEPGAWPYVLDTGAAGGAFRAFEEQLCLIGHSHDPCFFEWDEGSVRRLPPGTLELSPGRRYIANVGSVGQPRDGDPRASYAVVDPQESTVEIIRVPYDTEKAAAKIENAGLPVALSERLGRGL